MRISASFGPSTVRVNTEQFTRAVARPASLWHQPDPWGPGLPRSHCLLSHKMPQTAQKWTVRSPKNRYATRPEVHSRNCRL